MRSVILGAASALAVASPAWAADLAITRYSEVPAYAYERAPAIVVEERAPIVSETVVVRRPAIVASAPVFVDEYPIYAPPVYTYRGPVWHAGWGPRRFHHYW